MTNFVPILPQKAINMDYVQSLSLLETLVNKNDLLEALDISKFFPSPVCNETNTEWLKKSNIVGITPRITKTYWGIVKYAMTFPENAIHILPLFEPGCDSAIYSPVSWTLNDEFLDDELVNAGYETPEKQLKLIINILHCMGKTVGFDALIHCDKFSEFVFTNPKYFEWIKLNNERTAQLYPPAIDYNTIYNEVEKAIKDYLVQNGSADFNIKITEDVLNKFFDNDFPEHQRQAVLFGYDKNLKLQRRIELLNFIKKKGYETLPVTEHSPNRPVVFDYMKKEGDVEWAEFKVDNKYPYSKIFNSQTPIKLYPIDNYGYPETDSPYFDAWNYISDKFLAFQQEYNFDFLRADMAHNQLSHAQKDKTKSYLNRPEIWAFIKEKIRAKTPYFATLAEAFLNQSYYIDGFQDMENKKFDVVLGPLNFLYLNDEYIANMQYLSKISNNYKFKTCITSMSNDTDKEQNNDLYKSPFANEIRLFTGLFTDLPSYMGIGLETRDYEPISKDFFSNYYTNYQQNEYKWGNNLELFNNITAIRQIYAKIYEEIKDHNVYWLNTNNPFQSSWVYFDKKNNIPLYLFAINIDISDDFKDININNFKYSVSRKKDYKLEPVFVLSDCNTAIENIDVIDKTINLKNFSIGEVRIYKITK